MLPDNTWDTQETAFVGAFIMMPSFVLWVMLFGLQMLGLHDQWMRLVIWINAGSWIAFLFMWLIDILLEKTSMFAGGVS